MSHRVDPRLKKFDSAIYSAIVEYWVTRGVSPSQMELRDATLASITTVIKALKRLEQYGYLTRVPNEPRSILPTDFEMTLSREPVPPWEHLVPKKFWRPVDWEKS